MSDIVERLQQHIRLDQLDEDDQVALVPRWEVEEAAAEIERLRLQVKMIPCPEYLDDPRLHEVIDAQRAEIERLREELRLCIHVDKYIHITSGLRIEIERLRGARGELVVALHTLASHFENALYAFRDDDEARKKAEGDIAWAMEIASRHNHNGNRQ